VRLGCFALVLTSMLAFPRGALARPTFTSLQGTTVPDSTTRTWARHCSGTAGSRSAASPIEA